MRLCITPGVDLSVSAESILRAFVKGGQRSTAPRAAMAAWLAAAASSDRDFSAEDMWRELQNGSRPVGRATVFRGLDLLERDGLIDRIELPDGARRYRVCGDGPHHHHIVCLRCGKVAKVESCLSPRLAEKVAAETGFTLERHSVELFGRCDSCLASA